MNCCSSNCGWCGRCDDGMDARTTVTYESCDRCNRTLGALTGRISLQGVGVACSRECMDVLVRKHESLMRKVSA